LCRNITIKLVSRIMYNIGNHIRSCG